MAKIIFKNVCLEIPILVNQRLFYKNKNFSEKLVGAKKINNERGKIISSILDDITFECKDGDHIGILGHNGSGKTTLLRVISGIYKPSSGSVFIDGKISNLLNIDLTIKPEATGYENIKIFWLYKNKNVNLEKLIKQVEDFSELGDFLNLPIKNYSSGMQARLLFSLCTSIDSEILVVDEGIVSADEHFIKKTKQHLESFINTNKIRIYASHDLKFIEKNCNRLFLLKKGKLSIFEDVNKGISYYLKEYGNNN
jgi:ABC-type polysaccharide/polyol phosphate transport system ATPase subunit